MDDSKKRTPNPYRLNSDKSIQVRIIERQMAKLVNHYRNPATHSRWLQDAPIPPASKILSRFINDFFTMQQELHKLKKHHLEPKKKLPAIDPLINDLELRVQALERQIKELKQ